MEGWIDEFGAGFGFVERHGKWDQMIVIRVGYLALPALYCTIIEDLPMVMVAMQKVYYIPIAFP